MLLEMWSIDPEICEKAVAVTHAQENRNLEFGDRGTQFPRMALEYDRRRCDDLESQLLR